MFVDFTNTQDLPIKINVEYISHLILRTSFSTIFINGSVPVDVKDDPEVILKKLQS